MITTIRDLIDLVIIKGATINLDMTRMVMTLMNTTEKGMTKKV